MYIGRFVILGKTGTGEWYLGYRVSSRSFPNRTIRTGEDRAVVIPTEDAPPSDNPYISYNCVRTYQDVLIVSNGTHVDPIIDKVKIGYGLRDAMALSLLAMDYEHDSYHTPRIAAGLDGKADQGYLGIVADDQLTVKSIEVAPGEAFLIATYEHTSPTPIDLDSDTAEALCKEILECEYEHPVAALVTMFQDGELRMAARTAE
ncbi:MAG: IMP cyclohydrolase [Chloroflexota bacterium]|nr:IMP cyclohydrolase [Chloroflexota bacterium]